MGILKRMLTILLVFCTIQLMTTHVLAYRIYEFPAFPDSIVRTVNHYVTFGKVSMPAGKTAPKGGIKVKVVFEHSGGAESSDLLIAEGGSSADYKLEADAVFIRSVYYLLEEDYGYVLQGYYKSSGTGAGFQAGSPDEYRKERNLELIPGDCTIRGTVFLPRGMKASFGGEHLTVNATSEDGTVYSKKVIIPEGLNASDYFLCIKSGTKYSVSYKYYSPPRLPYKESGFYHDRLNTVLSTTPGAIEGIRLGIIHSTENIRLVKERALTPEEHREVAEKTSGSAISLKPTSDGDYLKLTVTSDIIDRWEKWGHDAATLTSGAIELNRFKLKGYSLYGYDKSVKDAKLVAYIGNTGKEFRIKPPSEGTYYYYCQAVFEYGLRSSSSNIVEITSGKIK